MPQQYLECTTCVAQYANNCGAHAAVLTAAFARGRLSCKGKKYPAQRLFCTSENMPRRRASAEEAPRTPGREAAGADSAGALSASNNDSPRRRSPRRGQASNGDSNQSSPLGGTPRSNALQRAPAAPLPSAPPRSPPRSSSSASMSDGVRKAWVAFAVNKKPDDWASVGACCWPARSSGGFLPSTKS